MCKSHGHLTSTPAVDLALLGGNLGERVVHRHELSDAPFRRASIVPKTPKIISTAGSSERFASAVKPKELLVPAVQSHQEAVHEDVLSVLEELATKVAGLNTTMTRGKIQARRNTRDRMIRDLDHRLKLDTTHTALQRTDEIVMGEIDRYLVGVDPARVSDAVKIAIRFLKNPVKF